MKIPCMKKSGKRNSCQIVDNFQWRIVPGSLQAFKSSQYVIYLITTIFHVLHVKLFTRCLCARYGNTFYQREKEVLAEALQGTWCSTGGHAGTLSGGSEPFVPPVLCTGCPGTSHSILHRPCVCVFDGSTFHRIYLERCSLVVALTLNVVMVLRSVVFRLNNDCLSLLHV